MEIKERIKELKDELIDLRRDFHQHPELAFEVGYLVLGNVVAEQGDRNDQRNEAIAIVLDQLNELLLFERLKSPLEVTEGVVQHVGVAWRICAARERGVELVFVAPVELVVGH